jgi:hypothetical protein
MVHFNISDGFNFARPNFDGIFACIFRAEFKAPLFVETFEVFDEVIVVWVRSHELVLFVIDDF